MPTQIIFEGALTDKHTNGKNAPPPERMVNHLPTWYKDLKLNLLQYRDDEFRYNNTIRKCLGMREYLNHNLTIPLYEDFDGSESWYVRKIFQPEMMFGTKFCNTGKKQEWDFALFSFPWRAKMDKGYSIMTSPYGLDWNDDINVFSGVSPVNHKTNLWQFDLPMDEKYSYANFEGVIAYKKGIKIPKSSVLFTFSVIKVA